jgi:hypothetical protein
VAVELVAGLIGALGVVFVAFEQTLAIHPNSNRGTENNNQNNFDTNGLSLRIWVPMCRVLLCCFVWLVEMSSAGR